MAFLKPTLLDTPFRHRYLFEKQYSDDYDDGPKLGRPKRRRVNRGLTA